MTEYRTSAHAVWDIKYHLIWITKYRYKVLRGEVAERARDLIRQICQAREVSIIRGSISPDHIHMLVAAPPQLSHGQAGAVHQGTIVAAVAGGVSPPRQTVLGTTSVGAGVFLRDGRGGG